MLNRGPMRDVAIQGGGELCLVVGVDLGVVPPSRNGHVTACVIRCVGDDSEPAIFSTWCPKLLAMIGTPADTLMDRSLVITLERKTAGEPVDRLRAEAAPLAFVDVRRRLRRWADDHLPDLRTLDPAIPSPSTIARPTIGARSWRLPSSPAAPGRPSPRRPPSR